MSEPKPKVLIAEDDLVFRKVITFSIQRQGFDVVAVGNGSDALEALRGGGFDFLVTDQQMPGMEGTEILQRVLDENLLPPGRAVLCTAKGLELDIDGLTQDLRIAGVLSKPFSPKQLQETIEHAIASETLPANGMPQTVGTATHR